MFFTESYKLKEYPKPHAFSNVKNKICFVCDWLLVFQVGAVIGWLRTESFVLSANLHGGALVASYPYDNSDGGEHTHRN